jgi:hypothetical protein
MRFWNRDFALGRVDVSRLNYGILCLIAKLSGADSIKQYRPIALINVIFKFISKAYAIRFAPLVLHEITHELRTKKMWGLLLKLDLEKAFDRVNWDFLREVLTRKGFSGVMVHCLMQLVLGGRLQ